MQFIFYTLLTTEASSIFDLIDINEGALISSTSPFDISFRGEGSVFVMDVNGDGKMELCRLLSSSLEVYSLEGTQFMLKDTYSFSGDYHTKRMQICDMNGDGLLDLMFLPNIGSIWTCFLNTGTGFVKEERSYPNLAVWGAQKVLMQDVNHDGKSDYLRVNDNQVDVFLNRYGELSLTAASSIQVPGDAVLPGLNICDGIHIATPVTFEGNMMHTLVFKGDERFSNVLRYMRDSRGNPHQYFYTDLTVDGGAYEPGVGEYTFPYYSVRFPLLLLSEDLSYMSGEPDVMTSLRRYTYTDAVAHRTGLGFCGFAQTRVTDDIQQQTEEHHYNPECMGVPVWNGIRLAGDQSCFKEKSFAYDSRKDMTGKWDPALIETVETDVLDSIVVRHGFEVDTFGYIVSDTLTYPEETAEYRTWVKRKEMLHVVSNSRYLTGLPVCVEDVVFKGSHPGSYVQFQSEGERDTIIYNAELYPSLIIKSRHHSRRVHTRIQSETVPVSSTRYAYDTFGHIIQEETQTRESTTWVSRYWQYSLDGRFCIAKTDELGLTESYSDFDRYGQPRQISDHAGRVTIRTFDTSGRLVRETLPTGEQKIMSVAWDGADRSWFETLSGSAIPTQKVYYDPMGRKKKTAVERFDGQWQQTVFHYDEKGRLNRQSRPFRNSATGWTTLTYDDYNRVLSKTETNGASSSWTYSPRTVSERKEGVLSIKRTDHCGRTIQVTDAGGAVSYTYDLCDRLRSISAPENIETHFSYNLYGDRTSMEDPSAGLQIDTLRYAADGTSVQLSTNPNGTLRTHYDIYGRPVMIERSDGFSTAYTYGNTGLLFSAVSGNGTGKVYTYDAFDRLLTETETGINGIQFTRRFQYDSLGRVASVMSLTEADTLATEEYGYSRGWKSEVRLGDSTLVWRLEGENDFGQPVAATTGSMERMYTYDTAGRPARRRLGAVQDFSYHFDSVTGNLLSRKDEIRQKTESFTYDNLNRLISAGNHSYIYDSKGNIISKTGCGAISYADTLHPYQATALLPDGNYMPTSNQTAVFSSYHRPSTLSENGWDISWDYNDAHDRVRMVLKKNGTARLKRHYLGDGVYERDENVGNVTERLYLGGDAYSAPMVYVRENSGVWSALNIGRDYLGSVTHVATVDGVLLAEYSYDAWGRRRNPDTWGYYLSLSQEPELLTGRGYTGHEALPEIGLINMNARLYDPYLGRFLSPDPYVQAPDFSQNFNRYSYALNNPLKYTDESGEWLHLLIGGLIGGVANVIANWKNIQSHDDNQFLWGLGYFGVGALAGSLSAGIGAGVSSSLAGASFGAGFWGTSSAATAASSFLTGAAIGASAGGANGFITGMGNSLMGGSSFASSLGNGVLDAVSQGFLGGLAGGLAGGISAKIKGNRFWDGASIMDHTMYDQQIPFVEQFGADNCLPASVESVDKSFGGNISQYDIRSHFGGDPNIDMLTDADVWTYYCKRSNHTLFWENSPFRRVGQSLIHMGAGDRVAITLDTSLGGHSVLLSKVTSVRRKFLR